METGKEEKLCELKCEKKNVLCTATKMKRERVGAANNLMHPQGCVNNHFSYWMLLINTPTYTQITRDQAWYNFSIRNVLSKALTQGVMDRWSGTGLGG